MGLKGCLRCVLDLLPKRAIPPPLDKAHEAWLQELLYEAQFAFDLVVAAIVIGLILTTAAIIVGIYSEKTALITFASGLSVEFAALRLYINASNRLERAMQK